LEHQQREGGGLAVHSSGIDMQLYDFKRLHKMAQIKLMWLVCDILGVPVTILGIIANMDNIKSLILFLLGIIYLCARGYYFIKQKEQEVKKTDIDIWHAEQDKQERMNKKNGKYK
jgi:predicted membrane channel-forming protein YqfA (hemolysin III family)